MNKYPVGARWEAREDDWLYEIILLKSEPNPYHLGSLKTFRNPLEAWDVTITKGDGNMWETFPNKSSAFKWARTYINSSKTRFKRIK